MVRFLVLLFSVVITGCTSQFDSNEQDDFLTIAPEGSKLNFISQPTHGVTDTKLKNSFSVEIVDKNDERILNFNGPITLSIEEDPAGDSQISGNITVNAESGVAVFNNISLTKKGLSFKLRASSGVATHAISDAFNISQKIYRSVGGNNTAPLYCGSTITGCAGKNESVTFSEGSVNFSGAVPDNIGVGDVIVWDSNSSASINTGDDLAFFYKRLSSTEFEVRAANGEILSSTYSGTNWAIVRAYTSVGGAVDSVSGGTENSVLTSLIGAAKADFDSYSGGKDLVTSNEQFNIAIYTDASRNDETTTINTGWVTDDHRYIRIYTPYLPEEVGVPQRHSGYFDASKVLVDNTGTLNHAFVINTKYTVIEGLTLVGQETVLQAASGSEEVELSNNIIKLASAGASQRAAIDLNSDVAGKFYVYNNVIYGDNSVSVGIYSSSATAFDAAIYHNTVYGLNEGLDNTGSANFVLKNNIFSNNTTDIQTCGCSTSESNITSDATSPNGGAFSNVTLSFQNPLEANFALHRTNDVEAIDQGTDLATDTYRKSLMDTTNVQRGLGNGWDIGAFESESLVLSDILQADFNYGSFLRTQSTGSNSISMMAYTESQRELKDGDALFNSNLIGLWSGNGTLGNVVDGTTLNDLSLSGNSMTTVDGATDNTMSYVEGQLNQAIQFDGVDDFASTGNISLPSNFTIAFWYKNDNNAPNSTITQPFSWNSSAGQGIRFNWGHSTAGLMQSWETDDGSLQYSTPLESSTWYHVAMTFESSTLKIYLNGNFDKQTAMPDPNVGLESINLGAGSGGTAYFDNGTLDEISVWDTALTPEQLKSLYEMQKAPYVSSGVASFTSRVFEATSSASSWWKLKPKTLAPYGKELPANTETEYSSANVDMTDIVGIWHLNETHGTIYDSSGNNNHSSLVAGTPAYNQPGQFNGALNFDGTDDYVFFGTGPSMSGSTDFTVSMWLKTTKDGATAGQVGMSLVSQRDPGWDGGEYLINIGRNYDGNDPNPGKVLFVVWEDGGPQVNNFWSYRRVDDGKWHHLLVVREGLTLRIYIDGTLDREATGAGPLDTLDPTYYTVFGRDELYQDRYYNGDLDEVAIWSRALSSSEVLSLYQRGALRVKYQVTGCETPTCSDASFVGPDGSSSSFFSEQSTQQSIIPFYNLYPLNSSRYFQYKVIFESDNSLYSPELDDVYIFSQ